MERLPQSARAMQDALYERARQRDAARQERDAARQEQRLRAREEQRYTMVRARDRGNQQISWTGRYAKKAAPELDVWQTVDGWWRRDDRVLDPCGCHDCRMASVATDGNFAPHLTHLINALTWTHIRDEDSRLSCLLSTRTRNAVRRAVAGSGDLLTPDERLRVDGFCRGGSPLKVRFILLKLWLAAADAGDETLFEATFDEVCDDPDDLQRFELAKFGVSRGLRKSLLVVTPEMWDDPCVARALYDADARVKHARAVVADVLPRALRRRGFGDELFAIAIAGHVADLLWPAEWYPWFEHLPERTAPRAAAPPFRLDEKDFPALS